MMPREHGAWAILLAPIMVGLIAAPAFSPLAAALFVRRPIAPEFSDASLSAESEAAAR